MPVPPCGAPLSGAPLSGPKAQPQRSLGQRPRTPEAAAISPEGASQPSGTHRSPFRGPRAKRQKFQGGLTDAQKATVCIWAERAADELRVPAGTAIRTEWRRQQQHKAVGILSLCDCTQAHYGALKAHFQALAGQPARALDNHLAHQANAKRQATWLLYQACKQAGLHIAYAAAICRSQNKCELADATEPQLKRLLYTVRNRSKAKAKQSSAPNHPF